MNGVPLVVGLAFVAASVLHAAQPVVRVAQPADLDRGQAEGIVVTSDGSLYAGPGVEPHGARFPAPGAAQVWATVGDEAGNVYLGTGPEGHIFKITSQGETTLFFTAEEPMITALALTPRGDLLAAAAPGGVIYRIGPGGDGAVWSETDELYVWVLVPAAGERVYAGTGDRGRILEIGADGRFEHWFDSDESHIMSLALLPEGALLAGGAGRGLVFRIDSDGHAIVLHEDDLSEVVALAFDGASVVAALLAPPEPEARRPVLRLRLPDRTSLETPSEAASDVLEEQAGPTLQGTIEGIAQTAEPEASRVRGRVVRVDETGGSTEIWSSTREAPLCLLTDDAGGVLFGTGEPGRLYRAGPDGQVARLATLDEAHVTELLKTPDGILLATGNPGRVYRLDRASALAGEYLSSPVDAGGPARWGSIRWTPTQAAGTEFYTRTGNSGRPDSTWSAWSPALRDGSGSPIVNPDGRFLQWRVHQSALGEQGVKLSSVTLTFEPFNRPPRLRGFRTDPHGEWVRGPLAFRWEADDPDADPVRVSVEYRPLTASAWVPVGAVTTGDGSGGRLVWETDTVDESAYEVRATAGDQAANAYGEGRIAANRPVLTVVVDRTPPEIELRAVAAASFDVLVEDRLSILRPLELIQDGEVRFTARPTDGVCDARREVFRVDLPAGSDGGWSVRGTDAAGNTVDRPLVERGGAD